MKKRTSYHPYCSCMVNIYCLSPTWRCCKYLSCALLLSAKRNGIRLHSINRTVQKPVILTWSKSFCVFLMERERKELNNTLTSCKSVVFHLFFFTFTCVSLYYYSYMLKLTYSLHNDLSVSVVGCLLFHKSVVLYKTHYLKQD